MDSTLNMDHNVNDSPEARDMAEIYAKICFSFH